MALELKHSISMRRRLGPGNAKSKVKCWLGQAIAAGKIPMNNGPRQDEADNIQKTE